MKEYLHLFEDAKNALPEEHSDKTIIDVNYVEGRAFYVHDVYWIGTREFFPSWVFEDSESGESYIEKGWYMTNQENGQTEYYPITVLYWLDLSKLTTKARAKSAITTAILTFDESPESEQWDLSLNKLIQSL